MTSKTDKQIKKYKKTKDSNVKISRILLKKNFDYVGERFYL